MRKVNPQQPHGHPHQQHFVAPSSPTYPPYATFVDVPTQVVYDPNDPNNTTYAYVYPLSPQFSVQYYATDNSARYGSYPGSPVLHPHLAHHHYHSPQMHPSSPPFSPTLASPPTHATFVLPPHHQQQQHFPPLHISSPVLNASSSPPLQHHQFIQPLHFDLKKRQEQLEQEYAHLTQFHPQNIYVRGLSATETDESFLELCSVYGPISSSKAIIDQKTGECKGYGFAMFEDQDHCLLAIQGLNAAGYQASLARVGQESFSSRLRSLQDENSTNIYISNLPVSMDEEGLEALFKPYQTISNRILRDPQSGMSRGVGFARLGDRQSASAIIEKYNGHSITGSSAPLQVRFADSPAQKKLKSQTSSTKKNKHPRHDNNNNNSNNNNNTTIFPFPIRPMMPITPETMLGIAPSSSNSYPRSIVTTEPIHHHQQQQQDLSDIDSLSTAVNQLDLKEKTNTTTSSGGLV
ncbi:hypothetical protein FB192DRAFT_1423692 [Mucor lusitanicus]|uniref:RRM domain-containing protein n=2 Tax=Mucor circinelloides f. lusitanicus TaxID=29924 RepID=A0A168NS87_MUCCL|nr:hypothetical protein FB192DRAFT_1423692 [Mucor lusitanicus]OAD06664.1 hypothetical protein MUCCIDRAFT_78298 [Mucor lusitanicus CBS 277.49]